MKTRSIGGAILIIAAALMTANCGSAEKEKEPLVTVEVTPAVKGPISQQIRAEGVIFPLNQASIAPKITSTVIDFKVQRGSRVKKGQLLAVLENKDLAAQAEASKGDFDQANANYAITLNSGLPQQLQKAELDAATAKAAFEAARSVYESRKDLYEQGAIPRRDLDSAEVALAQARSQSEQAQKQLADLRRMGQEQLAKAAQGTKESAEGHYRAAAAQLSYSEIRSPIDGVITDRPLYVGDLAAANQPILTVMDIAHLVAKAHVPHSEATLIAVGNSVRITVPNSEDAVKGRVILVSPALDPGSTTVEIWVQADRPGPTLKPGMTVGLEMITKTIKDAVVVPTTSVFKNADGAYYVLLAGGDDKAHQKSVEVGVKNAQLTQIVSGVNVGDPVVTSGGFGVADATAIRVEKPSAQEKGDSENAAEKPDPQGKKPAPTPQPKDKD